MGEVNGAFDSGKTVEKKTFVETENSKMENTMLDMNIHERKSFERRRFARGLILLALCSTFGFSSILALLNLTSSFLPEDNMGNIGFSVITAVQMLTAAVLLPFLNKISGVKRILTISFALAILFPLSFFYPTWYLFIPACIILGMALIFLLCNVYIYGTCLVYRYHQSDSTTNINVLMVVMSGIVNSSVGGGFLWGNILQYGIIDKTHTNEFTNNGTTNKCCHSYCNEHQNLTITEPPPENEYYILIGIYTGLIILACITSIFLEELTDPCISPIKRTFKEFGQTIRETLRLLIDPRGYLLILITMFIGMEEAFIVSVFTYACVNCFLGIAYVGYVMFVYGILQILLSISQWILVKYLRRTLILGGAVIIFITCYVVLLKMVPKDEKEAVMLFMIISAAFAIADSTIISNVTSVYGLVFEENVDGSFAIFNVWWSFGQLLINSSGQLFCVYEKLYILIGFSLLSFAIYLYLEYLIYKGRFSRKSE